MKTSSPALPPAVAVIAIALLGPLSDALALESFWVEVGDAGNEEAFNGYGAVDDVYLIGQTEVTNAEYAEFLNAVDPSGANALALYNANMGSNSRGGIDFFPDNGVASSICPRSLSATAPSIT